MPYVNFTTAWYRVETTKRNIQRGGAAEAEWRVAGGGLEVPRWPSRVLGSIALPKRNG